MTAAAGKFLIVLCHPKYANDKDVDVLLLSPVELAVRCQWRETDHLETCAHDTDNIRGSNGHVIVQKTLLPTNTLGEWAVFLLLKIDL